MRNSKYLLLLCWSLFSGFASFAQDKIAEEKTELTKSGRPLTMGTFKSTRLINMHTVENCGKKTLDVRISHRFGPVNTGGYNLYGLDGGASIRIGLEYSFDNRLQIGIGRSSVLKMNDAFVKYRLLRQTDDGHMPISVTPFAGIYYTAQKDIYSAENGFNKYKNPSSRLSYVFEMMMARKFCDRFSLQLTPFFVHYNLVDSISDLNDMYGVSAGARFKVTKGFSLTGEYSYRISKYSNTTYHNSLGIGFELVTSGHVFQIVFTNSYGLAESQFLPYSTQKWSNAGIRLGFNLSRIFVLGKLPQE